MTATIIGMLVDEGKLTWGSTIREVFPDVASRFHDDFQKVTLSQLLTHRAGLPANVSWWHLAGQTTTEQRFSISDLVLVEPAAESARLDLRVFERRLCPGRADGRTGLWPVLGDADAAPALRAARYGDRGVRISGPAGLRQPTLGPSLHAGQGPANPAGQRGVDGAGRHRPLLDPGLGQVRRRSTWPAPAARRSS